MFSVQFKHDWRVVADSHRIKVVREDEDHWTLTINNAIHLDEGLKNDDVICTDVIQFNL